MSWKRWGSRMKRFSQLAWPYMIWVILMILLPMLLILFYSLTTSGNDIINFTFTLDHFKKFFTDPDFLLVLWRSLTIAVKTTIICVVLGYPVAYFIARSSDRVRNILVLAITTRIGIVLLFESHIIQVSDFGGAFSASNTLDFSSDYHRVFTHWILYPTLIHGIYQIFGSSQLVALLTNAVILIVASILVYKVSSLLFKNKTAGFVSALLYIFWPSNILYTLIFTQEHICLLLLLIVLYLFLIIENKEDLKLSIKNVILLLLIGICLGLSTFFKNFAPAFIIAFIIYYFLKGFTEKNIKKYTLMKLGTIVIILIGFITTKNLVFIGIDHLAGHPVARNITPCYLNVGLNTNGTYNAGIYNEYFNAVKENDYDYDKANDEIMDLLKKRLSDKNASIWQEDFFDNKAKIIFGNDEAKISWLVSSINAKGTMQITNFIENDYKDWNNNYFIILVTLMSLGLISMNKNKDLKKFLLYLVLFGRERGSARSWRRGGAAPS